MSIWRHLAAGAALAAALVMGAARAQTPEDAQALVETMVEDALAAFTIESAAQADAFRTVLDRHFDTRRIARALAGQHWRSLDESQKSRYFSAFDQFLVVFYTRQLGGFSDGDVTILGVEPLGDKGALVRSSASVPGEDPIQADWRVRYGNGDPKIVDLIVEGVSLSVSQRSQFDAVAAKSPDGFESLIVRLENVAAGGEASDDLFADPS